MTLHHFCHIPLLRSESLQVVTKSHSGGGVQEDLNFRRWFLMEALLKAAYLLVRKHLQAHIFIQQLLYASHSSRCLDVLRRKTKLPSLNEYPEGKAPAKFWRDVRTWGLWGTTRSSEGWGSSWIWSWGGDQGLDHKGLPLLCRAFGLTPEATGSP